MMELCRQLGFNLTATDKDVIATELRLGGKGRGVLFYNVLNGQKRAKRELYRWDLKNGSFSV